VLRFVVRRRLGVPRVVVLRLFGFVHQEKETLAGDEAGEAGA
jgi:hypothetical protein